MNEDTNEFNREQAFQLYAVFCGDVERTAHALGVLPVDIIDIAAKQGWNDKLRAIIALKKSAAPGDVERGVNRALSFVQAHRMRLFIDRLLLKLSMLDNDEIEEYFFTGPETKLSKKPQQFSSRALADLASAIEKVTAVANQALCDTAQDRARRDESTEGGDASGALHAQIAAAMAAVGSDKSPAALLFDAQLNCAKQIALVVEPKPSPLDNDQH